MLLAEPFVSRRSSTDHDHHARIRPKCSSAIIAERFLDLVPGVDEKQAQLAGKENVASKIVDKTLDPASVLIFLVHKSNLSALLMANVARGFPPNQSCAIAFVDIVDVSLYCARGGTLKESANDAILGIVTSTSSRPPGRRLS
jgi:hypothetical protein